MPQQTEFCVFCDLPKGTCSCSLAGRSALRSVGDRWSSPWDTSSRRTIPTQCRYCRAKVWFHTNEYGSKVFFDELGPPWPKHECAGFRQPARERAQELPPDSPYISSLLKAYQERRSSGWDVPFKAVAAEPGRSTTDVGVVRDIFLEANLRKRLGVSTKGKLRPDLLGRLGGGAWGQITVHIDDIVKPPILTYTMLVDSARLRQLKLEPEDVVVFLASVEALPGLKPVWVCKNIDFP